MSSQANNRDEAPPASVEQRRAGAGQDASSRLPRTLQEHLAQKLRSAYHELADKPAFLGDPAVPAEFEFHLQRLEAVEKARHTEKVHNTAVEAVKAALADIAPGRLDPERPDSGDGSEPGEKG